MNLNILLPFKVFAEKTKVTRIVVETPGGSWGMLPNRLDCVTALTPGILTYETQAEGEMYVAVDEGVMVKSGSDVRVSVRRAYGGTTLSQLREMVEREFLTQDAQEDGVRTTMAKLEAGLLHRLSRFNSRTADHNEHQ